MEWKWVEKGRRARVSGKWTEEDRGLRRSMGWE